MVNYSLVWGELVDTIGPASLAHNRLSGRTGTTRIARHMVIRSDCLPHRGHWSPVSHGVQRVDNERVELTWIKCPPVCPSSNNIEELDSNEIPMRGQTEKDEAMRTRKRERTKGYST